MLSKLGLGHDLSRFDGRIRLHLAPLVVGVLCHLRNAGGVDVHRRVCLPHTHLGIGRMILNKGMIAHVLHGTVALLWMVCCRVPLPDSDGRHMIQDDAVGGTKI